MKKNVVLERQLNVLDPKVQMGLDHDDVQLVSKVLSAEQRIANLAMSAITLPDGMNRHNLKVRAVWLPAPDSTVQILLERTDGASTGKDLLAALKLQMDRDAAAAVIASELMLRSPSSQRLPEVIFKGTYEGGPQIMSDQLVMGSHRELQACKAHVECAHLLRIDREVSGGKVPYNSPIPVKKRQPNEREERIALVAGVRDRTRTCVLEMVDSRNRSVQAKFSAPMRAELIQAQLSIQPIGVAIVREGHGVYQVERLLPVEAIAHADLDQVRQLALKFSDLVNGAS